MKEHQKLVKDDINFLEYPLWVLDEKNKEKSFVIEKPNGRYEIISGTELPNYFDKKVFYCLLHKLYKETNFESYSLTTTRYEIGASITVEHNRPGKKQYENIMASLLRWKAITVHFDGIFYENNHHVTKYFAFIDSVALDHKTGSLSVRFNDAYIDQLKASQFCKLIDFSIYTLFSRNSSARLYEILVKSFKERNEYFINIKLLAEKMTFKKKKNARTYYPSDVLRYIKPAISEINKKTDLYISFAYNKDTGVCVFKKLEKPKELFIPAIKETKEKKASNKQQIAQCMKFFSSLPAVDQAHILKGVSNHPYFKFIPDQNTQIYAYMTQKKLWQPGKQANI